MEPSTTSELLFRVLVGLFVIVTPTLMFLGLYRGLLRMRDDELVAKLLVQAEREDDADIDRYLADFEGSEESTLATTSCESCGTVVRKRLNFCYQCGHVFESPPSSSPVPTTDD